MKRVFNPKKRRNRIERVEELIGHGQDYVEAVLTAWETGRKINKKGYRFRPERLGVVVRDEEGKKEVWLNRVIELAQWIIDWEGEEVFKRPRKKFRKLSDSSWKVKEAETSDEDEVKIDVDIDVDAGQTEEDVATT